MSAVFLLQQIHISHFNLYICYFFLFPADSFYLFASLRCQPQHFRQIVFNYLLHLDASYTQFRQIVFAYPRFIYAKINLYIRFLFARFGGSIYRLFHLRAKRSHDSDFFLMRFCASLTRSVFCLREIPEKFPSK